jgi:hypothetical protein
MTHSRDPQPGTVVVSPVELDTSHFTHVEIKTFLGVDGDEPPQPHNQPA